MNKHAILLTLAILIILIPFLGFPSSWKSFFTIVLAFSGLISYRLYKDDLVKENRKTKEDVGEKSMAYVDNLSSTSSLPK